MTPQRIAGIALLVVGIGLLWVGYESHDSLADQVHETFTGRYTEKTIAYLVGGAVTSVVGALMALIPSRKAAQ